MYLYLNVVQSNTHKKKNKCTKNKNCIIFAQKLQPKKLMTGYTTTLEALFPFENKRKTLDNMFTHLTPAHKRDINLFCQPIKIQCLDFGTFWRHSTDT